MADQDQYAIATPRNIEGIQHTYKSDAERMRARNTRARLKAKKQTERDQRIRDAIAKIPAEHRI